VKDECAGCNALIEALAEITEENRKLLAAIHRESEQWDRRAPHTAKAPHERYGYGPHLGSN
jgi:hypothetical protein